MHIRSAQAAPPAPATAVQEAQETAAQTRKEAASGDAQAVRKLASAKAAEPAKPSGPVVNATPPGVGQAVKVTA